MPHPWAVIKNGKQWSCAETQGCMTIHMKEKSLWLSRNLTPTVSTILPQWVTASTYITTSSHQLLSWRGLILHCCINLSKRLRSISWYCSVWLWQAFLCAKDVLPLERKSSTHPTFCQQPGIGNPSGPCFERRKGGKKDIVKFDRIDSPSISVRTAEAALTFYLISSYQFLTYFLSCSQCEVKAKGQKVYTVNTYVHLCYKDLFFPKSLEHLHQFLIAVRSQAAYYFKYYSQHFCCEYSVIHNNL